MPLGLQAFGSGGRMDAATHLDRHEQDLKIALGDQLGLEIADVGIAENEILEIGMIDVDTADLEEAAGAVRMLDQRKDRERTRRIVATLPGDEIARTPAQKRRDGVGPERRPTSAPTAPSLTGSWLSGSSTSIRNMSVQMRKPRPASSSAPIMPASVMPNVSRTWAPHWRASFSRLASDSGSAEQSSVSTE